MSSIKFVLLILSFCISAKLSAGEINYELDSSENIPFNFRYKWENVTEEIEEKLKEKLYYNIYSFILPNLTTDTQYKIHIVPEEDEEFDFCVCQNDKFIPFFQQGNDDPLSEIEIDSAKTITFPALSSDIKIMITALSMPRFKKFEISSFTDKKITTRKKRRHSAAASLGDPSSKQRRKETTNRTEITQVVCGFDNSQWTLTGLEGNKFQILSEEEFSLNFSDSSTPQHIAFNLPVFRHDSQLHIKFHHLSQGTNSYVQILDKKTNEVVYFEVLFASSNQALEEELIINMPEDKKYQLVFGKDESNQEGSLKISGIELDIVDKVSNDDDDE